MVALLVFSVIREKKLEINKFWFLAIYVLMLILDGVRYNRLNYPILHEKWKDEIETKKAKNQLLVLLYIFLSVFSVIALAIFLGSRDW